MPPAPACIVSDFSAIAPLRAARLLLVAAITPLVAGALSACAVADTAPRADTPAPIVGLAGPDVAARGETVPVGTANVDAADDPSIWRDPVDPSRSLIVATDKRAGLYVYGLDGRKRAFFDAGRVNNVDIVQTRSGVIVVASDRNNKANSMLALFRLDPASGTLTPLGKVASGPGEGYGVCVSPASVTDAGFTAFAVLKDGHINAVDIALSDKAPTGRIARTLRVPTQSEGCVVDAAANALYIGEEDAGIWRFDATGASTVGRIVAPVDNRALVADVEGLAILATPAGRYLLASSQGDNAYALFSLPDHRFVGRFRINGGAIGGTSETDGIAAMAGDFGPNYPGGLFIAQDGDNAPHPQNFKLVAWDDIARALKLPR